MENHYSGYMLLNDIKNINRHSNFSVFILSFKFKLLIDNHLKKEIIKELKKEITDLGGTPVKKHLLSSSKMDR